MAYIASRVDQRAISAAVREVEKAFAPQVVRIGHSYGEDWAGYPAIYFRVLVRDEAAKPATRLHEEVAKPLSLALRNADAIDKSDLHAYFFFRTVSEQEKLQDPDWD